MKTVNTVLISIAATVAVLGTAAGIYAVVTRPAHEPFDWSQIGDKIKSIVVPKAPIGNISPARDIRGTWISSLSKKGFQLYGRFEVPGSVSNIYENGDVELIIDDITDNIATGQMRYFNVCGHGQTIAPPPIGTINVPEKCIADTGFAPVNIRITGSALDFGTVVNDDISATMQATFTSDMIAGTMAVETPNGIIKGPFNLMKKK